MHLCVWEYNTQRSNDTNFMFLSSVLNCSKVTKPEISAVPILLKSYNGDQGHGKKNKQGMKTFQDEPLHNILASRVGCV